MPLTSDDDIAKLLGEARTIALVGASDNPGRASYGVMKFLQDQGYRVSPVNPRITGETSTANSYGANWRRSASRSTSSIFSATPTMPLPLSTRLLQREPRRCGCSLA